MFNRRFLLAWALLTGLVAAPPTHARAPGWATALAATPASL
jgi:hypothetical protein